MSNTLTLAERDLAIAIVSWLRPEIVSRCDEWPSPGRLHTSIRALGVGGRVLVTAGVFTNEGPYWGYAKDKADLNALPDGFDRRALDMAIFAFVQVASLDGAVSERDARFISGTESQDRVFRSMTECGYMNRAPYGAYDWTTAAGPWLVAAEQRSLFDYDMASDEDVGRALALIPERDLAWLRAQDYAPSFARRFLGQWYANEWHAEGGREFPSDDSDIPLTVALFVHMH